MNKVDIIKLAKAVKKKFKKPQLHYVSYCRRIERIKTDKRICAMTFDDGPTRENDVTLRILEVLGEFGAKGTFDVIGTTKDNYPDNEGKLGTPSWSGVKFDHYPSFNKDDMAGALHCGEIIDEIISSGHEVTNHTYSHVLFGKKNIIYSKRKTLQSFDEVLDDVKKLHSLMKERHGYDMKFSRPPHYVDKIKGNFTSYDVYSVLNYNYLAASFDGAGWLPSESEDAEVQAMILPLKKALEENPDALSGQIIFQKDGYNMSLRAPVIKGLKAQLELLKEYGYKVVTVSKLLEESPFADVSRGDEDFELFYDLQKDFPIVFTDNTLRPDALMTRGEFAMLIAPKKISVDKRISDIKNGATLPYGLKPVHPYSSALVWAIEGGVLSPVGSSASPDRPLTEEDLKSDSCPVDLSLLKGEKLTRRRVLRAFYSKI